MVTKRGIILRKEGAVKAFRRESVVLAAVGGDVFDGAGTKLGLHFGARGYVESVESAQSES